MSRPPPLLRVLGIIISLAVIAGACSDDDTASPDDGAPSTTEPTTNDASTGEDTEPASPIATPGTAGLVDETAWTTRVDEYLAFATAEAVEPGAPASPNRVLADIVRDTRDADFTWDPATVTVDTFASSFEKLDEWRDTGDFDLLYLINVLYAAGDRLPAEVIDAIESRMLAFRYWYDDPLPADRLDHKWFWSENHRIIFATIEYLAGQHLPDATFEVTGLTGAEHRVRARERIVDWVAERATYGFSEWHSNVYMQKNVTPLATITQWVDDPELVALAATALDLALLDVAAHLHDGNYGVTAGRTYQKDTWSATANDTWGLTKLVFDDTDVPYQSTADAGAVTLAMLDHYRVPQVILEVAATDESVVSLERHGVPLDPLVPVSDTPDNATDHPYTDVPFWWSQGALSTWQVIPTLITTADEYRLWETDLFSQFSIVKDLTGGDTDVAQDLAQQFAPFAAFGLMAEAHTATWRSDDAMLSTVLDNRPGQRRDQARAWQATLGVDAQVFTTHPGNLPWEGDRFEDDDMYWTGSASMPYSVQSENVAIHAYDPLYSAPGPPLDELFGMLDETHAWFPTEHFDEVVQAPANGGTWTIGRSGEAFVALWSMRPTEWRSHDPAVTATGGLTADFDLVAPGGADNVWIVEVGSTTADAFGGLVDTIVAAPIAVADLGDEPGAGFAASYTSPSQGTVGTDGPGGALTVGDVTLPVADHQRLDAPWGTWSGEGPLIVEWADHSLTVDLRTGDRSVA